VRRPGRRVPKLGEVRLEGRYVKLAGDYALSKNAKGTLYCRRSDAMKQFLLNSGSTIEEGSWPREEAN